VADFPKVSLIVVSYLKEAYPYLKNTLTSIEALNYPKEMLDVVLVTSGDWKPEIGDFKELNINHQHSQSRLHYPEGVNFAVSHSDPTSKHLMLLNDDVILTKDSLKELVVHAGDAPIVLGPISNCDQFLKYQLFLNVIKDGKPYPIRERFFRIERVEELGLESFINTPFLYPPGVIKQDFLCFYATLIPRIVWDMVGPLDPNFKTGQDDIDYSRRCAQKNIPMAVCLSSLIWHHGGVSADLSLTNEIRKLNVDYFVNKWGQLPP
jgi:GT2 family glycosyltransferase